MASKFLSGAKRAREIFDALANEVVFTGLNSRGNITVSRKQGQSLVLKTKTEDITLGTGSATSTTANWLPGGSMIMGLAARVTTTITGATASLSIGYTSANTAFSGAQSSRLAAGSTFDSYADGMQGPVVLSTTTGLTVFSSSGSITAGKMLVTIWYYDIVPQTTGV